MDIGLIRRTIRTYAFRRFVLTMNDGREFEIFHPDRIFVHENHVTIIDEGSQRAIHLEPILIASIAVDELTSVIDGDDDLA